MVFIVIICGNLDDAFQLGQTGNQKMPNKPSRDGNGASPAGGVRFNPFQFGGLVWWRLSRNQPLATRTIEQKDTHKVNGLDRKMTYAS
jgi:hypothetical protein